MTARARCVNLRNTNLANPSVSACSVAFILQSTSFSSNHLESRCEAFLEQYQTSLAEMTDKSFRTQVSLPSLPPHLSQLCICAAIACYVACVVPARLPAILRVTLLLYCLSVSHRPCRVLLHHMQQVCVVTGWPCQDRDHWEGRWGGGGAG